MKQSTKIRTAAANFAIPRDRDEADEFIFKIGEAIRDRAIVQNACDETIAAAKAQFEEKGAPMTAAIERLTKGLQTWCEVNRAELLADGGGKTVKFGNGEVAWRARPASVTLRNIEKIIEWCRARGSQFLRVRTEVSKEAMLACPDEAKKVPGVTIASAGEDFIVTPLAEPLKEAL